MLLKNIRYLVTQNAERNILENVDLLVEDGEIAGIGTSLDSSGHDVLDCSNRVVMPGLVNAHTHVPMTVLRGISDNKNLQDWLEQDIFPAEEKIEPGDAYYGSLLGIAEMLGTGTTCFNDMYDNMDYVAGAVDTSGIRAVLSRGVLDIDGKGRERIDEALKFVHEYQDHERITPGFAPHAVYTVSEDVLRELKDYSKVFDTPYHIHVSETEKENQGCRDETGMTPVRYLDSLGIVNEDIIAAHATWLEEKDIELLSNGGNVVHNPAANLKLGSGIADIPEMLENDINVAIGTDGVASNNNLNLFEEAKIAALIHKRDDPTAITEQDVLDMVTINGAKALGLEKEIGSVAVGKKADLITIDLDEPSMTPIHGRRGLISNLVYSFNGSVSETIVGGEIVAIDGNMVRFDGEKVFEKVRSRSPKFTS